MGRSGLVVERQASSSPRIEPTSGELIESQLGVKLPRRAHKRSGRSITEDFEHQVFARGHFERIVINFAGLADLPLDRRRDWDELCRAG